MANGNANPAQSKLDVDATMGYGLPKNLLIYAFGARLGGASIPGGCAGHGPTVGYSDEQPHPGELPEHRYSHNDPAGAYPDNAFFDRLVPFLGKVSAHKNWIAGFTGAY